MSAVDHPPHYQAGGLEVIDIMEEWALPQHGSHCLKYLLRAGRKAGASREEDLRKALWWAERADAGGWPVGGQPVWDIGEEYSEAAVAAAYEVPVAALDALTDDLPSVLVSEIEGML